MTTTESTSTRDEEGRRVLVVDDDQAVRRTVARWLERDGYAVTPCETGEQALQMLRDVLPDAVLLDMVMPGMGGQATLEKLLERAPGLPVLMATGETEVQTVVDAMKAGAYDYMTKPLDRERVLAAIRHAVERRRMTVRLQSLEREARGEGYPGIVGESDAMRELFRQLDRVAASDITVLIHGESGTGKELVARALHEQSARRDGPFVALNCAAIPETLQESELFGHEKGAFTGATSAHRGRFEEADGGTLFLDEVAELSASLQAKLLRALQQRTFRRVGGSRDISSDFRLLAATHKDLGEEVEEGRFRDDLFYRIAVFELEVPALRDREGDVARLCRFFLSKWASESAGEGRLELDPGALSALEHYGWPGNVRELENALRRGVMLAQKGRIRREDLPPRVVEAAGSGAPAVSPSFGGGTGDAAVEDPTALLGAGLPLNLDELERLAIIRAIDLTDNNLSAVGRMLGIGRTTLYRKLSKYGLRD